MSLPPPVEAARGRLTRWLLEDALPIWWRAGADPDGGFHDRLNLDGTPVTGAKRVRVQARQAWSYAVAAGLGWDGAADAACRHGLDFIRTRLPRPDGLYGVAGGAAALDGMGELYDQAFVLLALSAGYARFGDPALRGEAERLRDRLADFAHPAGGFAEAPGLAAPLFANPNMHLFESFMAWAEISDDPAWRALAAGQANLALSRLIDPASGTLAEEFGPDWRPAPTPVIWPGHLFEWAWLLMRWPDAGAAAIGAALRLIDVAERAGVDAARNTAIFALDGALGPTDRKARLWSQTERIKATALAAHLTGDDALWASAGRACEGLEAFLVVPTPGLWRDRMNEGGDFVEEAAPASSFYHIVCAIAEMARLAAGPA